MFFALKKRKNDKFGGAGEAPSGFTVQKKYRMTAGRPFFKNPMYLPKKGHAIRNSIESADGKKHVRMVIEKLYIKR